MSLLLYNREDCEACSGASRREGTDAMLPRAVAEPNAAAQMASPSPLVRRLDAAAELIGTIVTTRVFAKAREGKLDVEYTTVAPTKPPLAAAVELSTASILIS